MSDKKDKKLKEEKKPLKSPRKQVIIEKGIVPPSPPKKPPRKPSKKP